MSSCINEIKEESTGQFSTLSNKIIELIDKSDSLPWSKPWRIDYSADGIIGSESNLSTGKYYSGVNTIVLGWIRAVTPNYLPYWIGYNQCNSIKCYVNRGEKGYPIFYPKLIKDREDKDQMKLIGFGVSYVFNIAQTTYDLSLIKPKDETPDKPQIIIEAEDIIQRYTRCPTIREIGNKACYIPSIDIVHMPNRTQFNELGCYYKTLYHELIHSTGHKTRLQRSGIINFDRFGSEQYSNEELIAEFGSCFLTSIVGITCGDDDIKNSAGYLQGWKKKIKSDPMCLPKAAAAAEKAVRFILNGKDKTGEDTNE